MAKKKTVKKNSKSKRVVKKETPKPQTHPAKKALHGNWYPNLLRSLIAIILGIYLVADAGMLMETFLALIGTFLLVEGILLTIPILKSPKEHEEWGISLFRGILGILIGLYVLVQPAWFKFMPINTVGYTVATVALVIGLLEVVQGATLHKHLDNKYLMTLGGILSMIFGMLLLFVPIFSNLVIMYLLGIYTIIFGAGLLLFSFELKLLGNKI
ncbi:DUF308 domain-containing protein [Candidatus Woesearchaeota archaeon]|nr:DUF308 domain-containing protein [Candidatus Woesearchaeota archaeon]